MKTTEFQNRILRVIENEYKTCGDIAFEIKERQMHVGNSIKALLNKEVIEVWYDYPNNPKYIYDTIK